MLRWLSLLRAWGFRHYERYMFQRFLRSIPNSTFASVSRRKPRRQFHRFQHGAWYRLDSPRPSKEGSHV